MIDENKLKKLQLIMQADFSDLIGFFIEDSISRLAALKDLINKPELDLEAIKNDAHTLKGSSGNLFAIKLQTMYLNIEQLAAKGNLTNVDSLLKEIDRESIEVFDELTKFNSIQS